MQKKQLDNSILYCGNCLDVLPTLEANSIDSVVTDPPYGLSFMGQDWDKGTPGIHFWKEVLRVAKPGAYMLAFGGTRTFHRLACAIEDAGWVLRDTIMYTFGSGFPKSMNLGNGFGTALKPAYEPIVLAMKPLEGTYAQNMLKYGTGGLNIDGCRIGDNPQYKYNADKNGTTFHGKQGNRIKRTAEKNKNQYIESTKGRYPSDFIHDGSEEVIDLLDSAARFFYCAKASRKDRDEGLEDLEPQRDSDRIKDDGAGGDNPRNRTNKPQLNFHPTVKPTDLMRYLCRLVTPKNGIILDPFMGSGSTGKAAMLEGFQFTGIELEEKYFNLAIKRIDFADNNKS